MADENQQVNGERLAAQIDALSPRRLAVLTGAFLIALAALFIFEMNEKAELRVAETQLRVSQSASDGASALNIAIMTGAPTREALAAIKPGGFAAQFHLSPSGDILTAIGRTDIIDIPAGALRSLDFDARSQARLDLPGGPVAVAWRRLDNGDTFLVAAPARDIYDR